MPSHSLIAFHVLRYLLAALILASLVTVRAHAAAPSESIDARINELAPKLEAYVLAGMKGFDCPGLAIGIVAGDKLAYAQGFGVRAKGGPAVDTKTVFQIGSASKGFLATTMAIGVDRRKFKWDDRIVDLSPGWQLKDPWVTQEFRVLDIIAQRSGLPPYANDMLSILGFDEEQLIHSLRHVDPVSSFRSTFAYTNITHLQAGRIVAASEGVPDWEAAVRKDIFAPLGMASSSVTAEAIEAAPNHASGHRYDPAGTVEVPFTPLFPYLYAGAGAINSNIEDMAHWVRLQLGRGTFEGNIIVSPENLAVTHMARVAVSERASYAMGWVVQATANGTIVWHNGGTPSFGAFVGFAPDKDFGVIVLSNEENVGLPDAVGAWTLDRLLGNADIDYAAQRLKAAKAKAAADAKLWAKPAQPSPPPAHAALAGNYTNPSFGKAAVNPDSDALVMTLSTGAELKLTPWDGSVFTMSLLPKGRFAGAAANAGPLPSAFMQFQTGAAGTLDRLRLTGDDGQSYVFARE